MKAILSSILLSALCASAGAAAAHDCPCALPAPPAPPAPLAPLPPAPPVPPPIPAIPAGAHAACAGKPAGTEVRYVLRKGEVMTGTCDADGGKAVFTLRSYSLEQ